MARIVETFFSRRGTEGDKATADLTYHIIGTGDDIEVRNLVLAASPIIYDGMPRGSITIDPVAVQTWNVTASYSVLDGSEAKKPKQGDKATLTFDTTGETANVKFSRNTTSYGNQTGDDQQALPPPDHKGLIGVNGDKVEGVDTVIPSLKFSETHYLAGSYISFEYLNLLYRLTGTVNSDYFRGFAPGELLFLGAQGREVLGSGTGEITYNFAASPNVTDLKVGDITVARKDGWDYLWVKWEDSEDTDAKAVIKKPLAVYVEEVYPRQAFAQLVFGPLPSPSTSPPPRTTGSATGIPGVP
jgi:hypothetical protein